MKAYKNNDHEVRISVLETIVEQINQTLLRLENKIDINHDKLETKIDNLSNKIDEVRKENTSHFRTTILTLLTLIGTPLLMESIKLLTKFVHGS